MKKLDTTTLRTGDVLTTKNGNRYVLINGVSYNVESFDYIIHNRDGSYPVGKLKGKEVAVKNNKKDVVLVQRINAAPDANILSETLKWATGKGTKYTFNTVWQAEDPRIAELKKEIEATEKKLLALMDELDEECFDEFGYNDDCDCDDCDCDDFYEDEDDFSDDEDEDIVVTFVFGNLR